MTYTSRCPISNTNLDECESIFVWELTVPSSKTEAINKTRVDECSFLYDQFLCIINSKIYYFLSSNSEQLYPWFILFLP